MFQQQYPSVTPVGPAFSQGAKLSFLTHEAFLPPGPSPASEPTLCVSRLNSVHSGLQRLSRESQGQLEDGVCGP